MGRKERLEEEIDDVQMKMHKYEACAILHMFQNRTEQNRIFI